MTDAKFVYNKSSEVLHHIDCGRISLMNKENIMYIYEAVPENSRICVHCASKVVKELSKISIKRNESW